MSIDERRNQNQNACSYLLSDQAAQPHISVGRRAVFADVLCPFALLEQIASFYSFGPWDQRFSGMETKDLSLRGVLLYELRGPIPAVAGFGMPSIVCDWCCDLVVCAVLIVF
jgi:hypothetical protein